MNVSLLIILVIVFTLFPIASATYPTDAEIDNLLTGYKYPRTYEVNVYDCSDMSITLAKVMQYDYGWNTAVAGEANFDDGEEGHAWVVVETGQNRWTAIETTYAPQQRLGIRVYTPLYYTNIDVLTEWYYAYLYIT